MLLVQPLTDLAAAHEVSRAAWEANTPDIPFDAPEAFADMLRSPRPGSEYEHYEALLKGRVVGFLELGLPQSENLGTVNVVLAVHPAARRHGVGSALHALAVERTHLLARKTMTGLTVHAAGQVASAGEVASGPAAASHLPPPGDGVSPPGDRVRADPRAGAAFAAALGAAPGLELTRSRLTIADPALPPEAELRASPPPEGGLPALLPDRETYALPSEAGTAGYRLVQWVGPAPAAYLDDLAYLESRLHRDAPTGDLDREPDLVDAERFRAGERALQVRRRTPVHTGAVHEATGRLIAWTMLATPDATPWQAWQYITLVDPDHRGHRLGLRIKTANLRYALSHRPELRALDTLNAVQNERILLINRAMGFRPVDVWTHWQQTV